MMRLTKIFIALALAGTCTTLLAQQDVSETRSVDADAYISISNAFGEISISGWDKNEVSIEGSLGEDVKELIIRETGSGLMIEVKNPKSSYRHDNGYNKLSSYLEVKVPVGARVEAESVSADISVEELAGDHLAVSSVSGDIDLEVQSKDVEVESVSGDVEYRGSSGSTSIESVSGDLEISGVTGELSAASVSGDITVEAGDLSDARFETVSGDLDITAGLSSDARLTVESLSGDVTLTLPDSVSARFEASSFSGDIYSDFGGSNDEDLGSSAEFTTGDGSARVRLESFSADIEINVNQK